MQFMGSSRIALAALLVLPGVVVAQDAPVNAYGNPARVAPAPTTAAINERDLKIRLYQFADDSMMGRQVGRVGNMKGTDYIAAEVRRLGLLPAGDNGSYFQVLPYHLRKYTEHSKLTVDGNPLVWNDEWVAVPANGQRAPRAITAAEVIFGGVEGDTATQITAAQAAGKLVVLLPSTRRPSGMASGFQRMGPAENRFANAVAIARINLDDATPAQRIAINNSVIASMTQAIGGGRGGAGAAGAAVDSVALLRNQLAALAPQAQLRITRAAAAKLFQRATVENLSRGSRGGVVTASLHFVETPTDFGRNVVAMIPGSDPKLKHQYVAIGAHNDHVGFTTPVDKDSLKAYNDQRIRLMIANNMVAGPDIISQIRVNMDSIRRIHPTPRLDSINNGADDDGSGSMGVLEIAEAMMACRSSRNARRYSYGTRAKRRD